MKKVFLILFFILSLNLFGKIWNVGPTYIYVKPSQVATLVQNGDTVLITAGTYLQDVCAWTANNLLIKGVNGKAILDANGIGYGGKAIWVVQGNNTTIENITFLNCKVTSLNGAGIRLEGTHLNVRYCLFKDNENGILAGDNTSSDILIEYTEFDHNGYGDGYTHNLYINHLNKLTFRYNYSHHAHIGHELKSRAHNNIICYNRFSNEQTGDASREIDLPNGGLAVIMGNVIEQGPNSQNSNIIGYGLEGLNNPGNHECYIVNNTVVNDRTTGTFIQIQNATALLKMYNNIFAGTGTLLSGIANVLDSAGNFYYAQIANAGFANSTIYDYHLTLSCSAINKGKNAGSISSISLTPAFEYLHPASSALKTIIGIIDPGAFESSVGTAAYTESLIHEEQIYFNPFNNSLHFIANQNAILNIYTVNGAFIKAVHIENNSSLPLNLSSGIYLIEACLSDSKKIIKKIIIP